jgi:hypothetical protein
MVARAALQMHGRMQAEARAARSWRGGTQGGGSKGRTEGEWGEERRKNGRECAYQHQASPLVDLQPVPKPTLDRLRLLFLLLDDSAGVLSSHLLHPAAPALRTFLRCSTFFDKPVDNTATDLVEGDEAVVRDLISVDAMAEGKTSGLAKERRNRRTCVSLIKCRAPVGDEMKGSRVRNECTR